MALTRFSGDADVISQLSDQPNDNDGLSADQLKAKFDQFGATFKEYVNETLIPELESAINAAAAGIGSSGFSGSIITDRTISESKLSNSAPTQAVSTQVIRDGAVTAQKLASAIQTLLSSVPGKAVFMERSVTLLSNGWTNNQQEVEVDGVTATNAALAFGGEDTTSHTAWSNNDIWASSRTTGKVTFSCRTPPSSNVTVNILILDTEE